MPKHHLHRPLAVSALTLLALGLHALPTWSRPSQTAARAIGTGRVFVPNAVTSTDDTTLRDRDDSASAVPDAAYSTVELLDLDGSGTLAGPFVSTFFTPRRVTSPELDFTSTRAQRAFEEVEAYWAIDYAQRYIQRLGIRDAANYQIGVNAHAFPDDFSFGEAYSDGRAILHFGDGGVDDAEDAEVVWYVYGRMVFFNQYGRFARVPQTNAIERGFGSYFAAALSTTVPGDPRFHETLFEWDAVPYSSGDAEHPWPHASTVVSTKQYPHDLEALADDGGVFGDGEIWAAALWKVRQALGRDAATRIILNAHPLLRPNPDFVQGLEAILESDRELNGWANAEAIAEAFAAHGIVVKSARELEVVAAAPASARRRSRLVVRVIGDQFEPGATASFGEKISVLATSVISPTELQAEIKIKNKAALGAHDVVVTNPDGSFARGVGVFQVKSSSNASGSQPPGPGGSAAARDGIRVYKVRL
jgi:hypothetical protein